MGQVLHGCARTAEVVRREIQMPLDECLYALKEQIPRLTRSSLHRLFQRNGISKLPENKAKKPKKKFKKYPI